MIGTGPLAGYRVPKTTIMAIRSRASGARDVLDLPPGVIRLEPLLERLMEYGINYDVIDECDFAMLPRGVEACSIPEQLMMYFRESTYAAIAQNAPRAQFTVFHELGHILLGHSRLSNRGGDPRKIEVFEDSEWQANQYAAEFLMPLHLILSLKLFTPHALAAHFGVSLPAANKRISQLTKRKEI